MTEFSIHSASDLPEFTRLLRETVKTKGLIKKNKIPEHTIDERRGLRVGGFKSESPFLSYRGHRGVF